MSQWYALYYPLKPGSEEKVGELFAAAGRPVFTVSDDEGNEVGRLLGTLVFVGAGKAVRVIEVEGPLPVVAAHMSRQQEVRAFEREIEQFLAVSRDMTTPEGARTFFLSAMMQCVETRGGSDDPGSSNWQAVLYPLKPDSEDAVAELFRGAGRPDLEVKDDDGNVIARLLGSMAFVGNGRALRVNEIDGPVSAIGAHMSRQGNALAFQKALDEYLAVPRDMSSPNGAGAFFREAGMACVVNRRHDRPL